MAVAVFLLIAVLFVVSVPGVLFIKPDTAIYMGLGRSLGSGEGYRFNGAPYGKYPPVFPLMLAAVYATAGESIWLMQAVGALCGAGAIAAAFALVRGRSGSCAAWWVVALTASCTWFQSHSSGYVLSGAPYALWSLLAIWLAERATRSAKASLWHWLPVAACAALAISTHLAGAALIPALAGGVLLARGRKRQLAGAALVVVLCSAVAAFWLTRSRTPDDTTSYSQHLSNVVPAGANAYTEVLALRVREYVSTPLSMSHNQVKHPWALIAFGLFLLPGLVKGLVAFRGCAELYFCAYFAVLAVAGGLGGHERYVVPVLPLVFYYGVLSVRVVLGAASAGRELPRWAGVAAVVVGVAVVGYGAANRVKGKRGARVFRGKKQTEAAERVATWQRAGQWADRHVGQDETLFAGCGGSWSIVHFFMGRRTVRCTGTIVSVERVVRSIADSDADFLVADSREWTKKRLPPVLAAYPECFTQLESHGEECALYRIDKARLRELVAQRPGTGERHE